MFQITDRTCPQCFRILRVKSHGDGLYCPDTLNCRWERHGPIERKDPRISRHALQEDLRQALSEGQAAKALRINALLARWD